MSGRTAKLTRPEPRWRAKPWGWSSEPYRVAWVGDAFYAWKVTTEGVLEPIAEGQPSETLEAAKVLCEAARWGHK